jgi:hypothetical protein
MGQYFMEPRDYHDTPTREVLHFIRSVGLIGIGMIGMNRKGKHSRYWRVQCKGQKTCPLMNKHTYT